MSSRFVYADNAATTPVADEVLDAMLPWLKEGYGNPSGIYAKGREARKAVDAARTLTAAGIGAAPGEVFFTASGSEADNWAVKGVAWAKAKEGKKHLITSGIEHHAVLHPMESLRKEGFEVTLLPVGPEGVIRAEDVASAIRGDTALVSVMYANNEIGAIQPVQEIGELCRERGVFFHTDAVQAIGHLDVDVKAQSIDLLSLSGHKIYAPKGIGALYIRKGVPRFPNLIDGGGQEMGRRAGTENVASIVGLGAAMKAACRGIGERNALTLPKRDRLIEEILKIPGTRLNGHPHKRLPGNVNVAFEGIEGERLILMLDGQGIAASAGSACASGSVDPSHVLLAIGLPYETAHGSLRLTINEMTADADVDYILRTLPDVVRRLRG
ncbi:MAG: aminotransferase class V-fold PLP-dependent enzyme [Peptococcaceae bacterium]|jgi:cysteine desulfurase|nr:aminotransferase class V-fold PLP-dependent enzyme [Peptococcaceae bacterium]